MKKIGLVGGISWISTLDYYRYINEGVNEKLGGLNFAECVLYSLNFGEVQARGWDNSFDLLLTACESLKRSGVEAIALCANTAHIFAEELESQIQLPLIHIAVETTRAVYKLGYKRVGLLGTKFTMEMSFYKNRLAAAGLEVLIPHKQETRDYIQSTIKEELGVGVVNPVTKENYRSIVKDLEDRGAECIILGCTELPMLISQADVQVPVLDTTKIHSQAIVAFAISTSKFSIQV